MPTRSFFARSTIRVDELAGDALVHDDAAGGGAALAGGAERAPQRAVEREIEIRVVEHDHGVLAAHLQRAGLEAARQRLADDAPDFGRSGEGDGADLGMLDERRARLRAEAGDDVDHALRQARPRISISTRLKVESGVSSAGLITQVLPQTSAGNIFHDGMAMGKFHGVIMPQTPTGMRTDIANLFCSSDGRGLAEEAAAFARHVVGGVDSPPARRRASRQHLAHLARHVARELFLALSSSSPVR